VQSSGICNAKTTCLTFENGGRFWIRETKALNAADKGSCKEFICTTVAATEATASSGDFHFRTAHTCNTRSICKPSGMCNTNTARRHMAAKFRILFVRSGRVDISILSRIFKLRPRTPKLCQRPRSEEHITWSKTTQI
jgi:hypothetical protein